MCKQWVPCQVFHSLGMGLPSRFQDESLFFGSRSVEGLDEVVEEDLELLHTEHTLLLLLSCDWNVWNFDHVTYRLSRSARAIIS